MSRRARGQRRDFARTERVGELVRQIVAEELAREGDERLELVSITGVEVDNELEKAVVFYDVLDEDATDEVEAALWEIKGRLRSAVGRQAHIRRTPDLVFELDPSIAAGRRVEELLAGLDISDEDDAPSSDGADGPTA
ncbi:MAG: 30S ribosome-binding factor RbfA [Actinomycetota bacterium]